MITKILFCLLLSFLFTFEGKGFIGSGEAAQIQDASSLKPLSVSFTTSDGVVIKADFYNATKHKNHDTKQPTVILLHMLSKSRSTYSPLIPKIINSGYNVLNIDFRGHGQSTKTTNGKTLSFNNFSNLDWQKILLDVEAALNFLSKQNNVNMNEIFIIGASIGANSAIITASKHPDTIKGVIALSPGMDFRALKPGDYIKKIKSPILLLASEGDTYSVESAEKLDGLAPTVSQMKIFSGNAHGTDLFASKPDSISYIEKWFESRH